MSNFFKIFIVPTGDATDEQIGISESLITSAVAGVVFALCAGQPLIITGIYVLFLESIGSALNHTYKYIYIYIYIYIYDQNQFGLSVTLLQRNIHSQIM